MTEQVKVPPQPSSNGFRQSDVFLKPFEAGICIEENLTKKHINHDLGLDTLLCVSKPSCIESELHGLVNLAHTQSINIINITTTTEMQVWCAD